MERLLWAINSVSTKYKGEIFINKIIIPLLILSLLIHQGHAFENIESLNVSQVRFYSIYLNDDYSLLDNKTDFSDYYILHAGNKFYENLVMDMTREQLRFNENSYQRILEYLEFDSRVDIESIHEYKEVRFRFKDQPDFIYEVTPWGLTVDYTYKQRGSPEVVSFKEIQEVRLRFLNASNEKVESLRESDRSSLRGLLKLKRPQDHEPFNVHGGNLVTMIHTSDSQILNVSRYIWVDEGSNSYNKSVLNDYDAVLVYKKKNPMEDISFIGYYPAGYIWATYGYVFLNKYYKEAITDEFKILGETKNELEAIRKNLQNKSSYGNSWGDIQNLSDIGIRLLSHEERTNRLDYFRKSNELVIDRLKGTWIEEAFLQLYISDGLSQSNFQLREMRDEIRKFKEEKKDLFEIALAYNQNANFNQTLQEMKNQTALTKGALEQARKQTQRSTIMPVFAAFIGVILGAVSTYGVHLLLEKDRDKGHRKGAERLLKIEIKFNLIKLEHTIKILEELKSNPGCGMHAAFALRILYRKATYDSHIRDLSLLEEETLRKICELYNNYSTLDHAEPILYEIFEHGYSKKVPFNKIFFENFFGMAEETIKLSRELIEKFESSKL